MKPLRPTSIVLAIALIAGLGVQSQQVTAASDPPPKPLVFGMTSIDFRADIPAFIDEAGVPPALFGLFWPLELAWPNAWAPGMLNELHDLGVVAYLEITTDDLNALNTGARDVQLAGLVDSLDDWFAESSDHRLIVAPLPEPNLSAHPWGGDPVGYKAGYLRIRDAFRDADIGSDQVRFVFAMNGLSDADLSYPPFYPGDDVVDLVGFSKINRGGDPWRDYDIAFSMHIDEMRELTTAKPILITQSGTVVDGNGLRGPWLTDMFEGFIDEPQVLGAVYFSRDVDHDYRILINGELDRAVVDGYPTWDEPSALSWVFDGSMDLWIADRASAVGFDDIGASPFDADIIWVAAQGITLGCGPRLYCPDDLVTRGQMASFLARALGYPAVATDWFDDDDGTTHESNINRIADAGVTLGCVPGLYCPSDNVTREQMASFLTRALGYPESSTDWFTDDDDSPHERNIDRIADAGVTLGCGPALYCPTELVTRGQIAAFLRRACETSGLCATD